MTRANEDEDDFETQVSDVDYEDEDDYETDDD